MTQGAGMKGGHQPLVDRAADELGSMGLHTSAATVIPSNGRPAVEEL
jgi:hypothetical protein